MLAEMTKSHLTVVCQHFTRLLGISYVEFRQMKKENIYTFFRLHDQMATKVVYAKNFNNSNYPLAQQSCRGDIGSVSYVHAYARIFTFCHRSSDLIYYPITIQLYTSVGYGNTSKRFAFQHDRVKVKVAVTIFRKKIVITLAPSFINRS